jgi:L-seryl-tRNA(Ser) seleniumtransferase
LGIFEELGVTAYINANEWYTSQGGSMVAAPVAEAMAEAAHRAVRLVELQNAVGAAIARLTQNEAACVTCSATAGIVLAVAAFMAELDPKKSERLPNTRGLKKEVVLHRCDHFGEDEAIRIPGALVVEIGDRHGAATKELEEAITSQTAAVFTTPPREGMVPLEEIVRICRARGVGVIVDIAWALPPKEHLWRFTRDAGADVVIVSGGKGLRGPQGSGLILGREEVVKACRGMVAPECRIGRPMKVGREAMVGIYAAVKHLLAGGAEATQQMAAYIAGALDAIPGLTVRIDDAASHVHLTLAPSRFRLTRDQVRDALLGEEPRILVRPIDAHGIGVNAGTLMEGQEQVVARRLREVLSGATVGSDSGVEKW